MKQTNDNKTSRAMLDSTARRIIRLHEDEGWHVPNISRLTGTPVQTIRQVLLNHNIEPLM